MNQAWRLLVSAAAGAVVLLFLSGCLSTHPGSSSLAYVDIDTADARSIRDEAVRVLEDDGYGLVGESVGQFVFEREATQRDRVLFGQYGDESLTMRVVVTIEPRRKGGYLVRADAYAVHSRYEDKVPRVARRPYQALLNRVKASLVTADNAVQ